ncbi:MAG: MGMT family protein [Lachnospiraceae bacterium]|nr:MGMT family protein [Lachnospiraceae bacterium]
MDFYKRVALVCQFIPYGKVATYGQIALLCQKPKNARQVGYALNKRIVEEVPAHRVVNHQGYLTGAGAFHDDAGQRRLLKSEGVGVDSALRVDLKKFGWKNTMDDALYLEAEFKKMDTDNNYG